MAETVGGLKVMPATASRYRLGALYVPGSLGLCPSPPQWAPATCNRPSSSYQLMPNISLDPYGSAAR